MYRLTLQKKTDDELFIVDTKGDDKGILLSTLAHRTDYLICFFLSSQIFATILPRYSEVAPNNISAFGCPCSPCTPPKISRQLA